MLRGYGREAPPRQNRPRPAFCTGPRTTDLPREVPAVLASFSNGVLTVVGDANSNFIEVSRTAAGNILVKNGQVPIVGGMPTLTNTTSIQMFGLDGTTRSV